MIKVHLLRFLLSVFWIFPVNKKKVFFSSFEGKKEACNPKYIYEYIIKHNYDFKCIWENNNKKGKNYVKHNSIRYIYHVLSSKYVISNNSITPTLPIRKKKQIVVNTWHGGGAYKKVGKDVSASINGTSVERQKIINKQTSFFLASSKKWAEVISEALEYPIDRFVPTGMARNAIMFSNVDKNALKEKYGFNKDVKICLYAPTFRGNTGEIKDETYGQLDAKRILDALKKRFGGEWIFATRCHYFQKTTFLEDSVDLTWPDDMQELLIISDVLISDYSSSIWDFSLTFKPCFLFCYDFDRYKGERDFYIPIENWGFPVSSDFEMLIDQILTFDEKGFVVKMKRHHEELGSYESPESDKKSVEFIFNYSISKKG